MKIHPHNNSVYVLEQQKASASFSSHLTSNLMALMSLLSFGSFVFYRFCCPSVHGKFQTSVIIQEIPNYQLYIHDA